METFAQRIAKQRQNLGLTQKEVAQALKIPLSTYKEWEYGRRVQGEEVYVKLSEVLELNLRTLLTGEVLFGKDELVQKVQTAMKEMNEVKKSLLSL
jgi:transcriptional regulator with XRE-family HTH domain